uniref:MAT1 centre domain-containing protein n=1 Tax=Phaeomonas parva TaxID=124430 RepID=A0A6U4J468_9STRA|mmetsp:Transcript_40373/g.126331  ORF Transcript_40373/g.126331 Transcript_40373/m.126331 type:complete len:373 (+) Transcript_40373:150-1268(+)
MRYHSQRRQATYGDEVPSHVPTCAKCGRAEDATSNLQQGGIRRLFTSYVCGHRFCEDCRDRHFLGKRPCPGYPARDDACGKLLSKSDLVAKDYLDILAEKDEKNRREVMAVYNKYVEDFDGDETAYNNYLEEAEDCIFRLSQGINVPEVRAKLDRRRKRDAEVIRENAKKRNQYAEEELKHIRQEREERERRERRMREEAEEVRAAEVAYQKQRKEFMMGQRTTITEKSGEQVREEQRQRRLLEANGGGGSMDLAFADVDAQGEGGHATSMASMWLNPDYKPDIRTSTVTEYQDVMRKRRKRGADKLVRQLAAEAAGYRRETLNQVRRLEAMTGLAPLLGDAAAIKVAAKLKLKKVRKARAQAAKPETATAP